MALSTTQIQQLYTAYLGRPVDREGLDYWQEQDVSLAQLRDSLANDAQPEYVDLYGDRTRAEVVEAIYQNMFGRAADADGLEYWVNGGGSSVPVSQLQQLFIEAASAEDRINFNDRVEADEAQIPPAEGDGGEGVVGETIFLTDGRDNVVGTENDDTFIGDAGQNQNGAVANAFATGDRIDGGAGRDKIEATLLNDSQTDTDDATLSINARTVNVEEVYLSVLDENVVVDGGRMDGVEQFWSDDSDANLILEDIRLGTGQSITKDITFGMRDVDQQSGLSAAFESQSLIREAASQVNSSLLVRIADVSTETPTTPLANVDLNLSFDLGGETVTLANIRSTDGTYAGLVEALRNELAEEGYSDVNVNLSTPYSQVTVAGNTVTLPFTAQEILITDPDGGEFSNVNFTQAAIESVPDGFLVAGNAQPQDPAAVSSVIESNLVLDNAGRGSVAGDAVIGGMSNSGTVVEKLNLIVDRNSRIDDLATASGMENNAFNEADYKAFEEIVVTSTGANGNLAINDVQNVYNFDATAFEGQNLTVSGQAGVTKGNAPGADWAPNAENVAHVYNTANDANSNDSITVVYSADKAAEFAGFSLSVNTGGGNDSVKLESVNTGGFNLVDQQDLANVTVTTGEGDDTVWTKGAGAVRIDTGSGNDTIYTDNSGEQWADKSDSAATWLVNSVNENINDLEGGNFGLLAGTNTVTDGNGATKAINAVLFGAELTISYSGANAGGGVTSGNADAVAAAFANGFESTVDVLTDTNQVFGDQRDINAAIVRAINEDSVLSKLLVAEAGPDHSLVIRSLIDGSFVAEDLEINLTARDLGTNALNTAEQNRLVEAIQQQTSFSGYDGTSPALQDILNDSVATANGLEGLGVDGAKLANISDTQTFTTTGLTYAANGSGDTLTITVDGNSVTLTEGADFTGDGTAAALVGETVSINGVTYTLGNDAGDLTVSTSGTTPFTATVAASAASTDTGTSVAVTTDLTGTQSTADNDGNVINAGTGDDVIVLSTSADSNETIVFEGNFGNDTVVNFEDNAGGTAAEALDTLDFTSYLTTEIRTSPSTGGVSEERIATTVDANGVLVANEIQVVNFTYDNTQNNGANTFEALTGAQLLTALNGDGAFGNLVGTSSASDNAAANFGNAAGDVVGATQQHLVMVQNAANEGEYKVFQLTSVSDADANVDAGDFASATLVGTVDFGNTVDFTTVGIA